MGKKTKESGLVLTAEEQARVKAALEAYQAKEREEAIQTEIRNQILDSKRGQPGYQY